jgi:hypothetical protein
VDNSQIAYDFEITREWIDLISDEKGLTNGQQHLLDHWAKGSPYVGKFIPQHMGEFLEKCKGYRGQKGNYE